MPLKRLVRGLLIFGAIYLFFDALLHIINLRLLDTAKIWPSSAIVFAGFMSQLYAAYAFLVVAIIWVIQKDLKKYQEIIFVVGIGALLYGGFLGYWTLSGFSSSFMGINSLRVWLPFYPLVTLFESIFLIVFGTIVICWKIKDGKNS